MNVRSKTSGPFIAPLAGNVISQLVYQLNVNNPTAEFWVRANSEAPVLIRFQPWVVAAITGCSLLVGNSGDPDAYVAAGDVDEATPGASAEKKYRFTSDTKVLVDLNTTEFATGVLTFTGIGVEDETVTIGDVTYTWKAAPSAANEVDIGVDAATCVTNLVAAINAGAGAGTLYGTGTVANPKASAADGAGDTIDLTSKVSNDNTIPTTETMTNASFGAATLTGATDSAGSIDLFVEA